MGFLSSVWNGIKRAGEDVGEFYKDLGQGAYDYMTMSWVDDAWDGFKKLLVPDMRRDREAQIQSATNARNIVYGRTRVGNQIAYAESAGDGKSVFHILCLHAAHEIDGYEEIYFDDKLVASAVSNWAIQAPFTGKAEITFFDGTQTAASAAMIAASEANVPSGGWGAAHKLLGIAYTHVKLTYDEGVYPTGMPTVKAVIRGKRVLDTRTGLIAWSVNPAMCIRDYMLLDVDHGGMGCDADEIREASFITAANICDQTVESNIALDVASNPVTPGVKALYKPVVGSYEKRYTMNGQIVLDGPPTSFVKSMLSSMAGEAIYSEGQWKIFAGAPSASVATIDESWLNGGISFQTGSNKNDKNNTVKGTFTNSNDFWADTEFPEVPTGASTPPNVDYWTLTSTPFKYDAAATYVVNSYVTWAGKVYKSYDAVPIDTPPPESSYWVLVETHDNSLQYPPATTVQRGGAVYTSTGIVPISNSYLAEDGGEVLVTDIVLPFTTGSSEAQRLAKITLEKSRRGFVLSYPCNHRAFKLEIMDVVTVQNERMGINRDFRVIGWDFSFLGGTNLSLVEYDGAIYDWLPGDSTPLVSPEITNLPDPWTVAAPTDFTCVEELYTGVAIKNTKSKLNLAWVSAQASATLYDIAFDGTIIQTIPDTAYTINDLAPGTYDVSVRAKNTLGAVSSWVTIVKVVLGKDTPPATVADFTASFVGNLIKLTWTPSTEYDLAGYEIRAGASWAAGEVMQAAFFANSFSYRAFGSGANTYWIKAFDTAGNESVTAATSSITVPVAAPPTAIVPTGVLFGIDVAVAHPDTLDIDYCELWASTSNNRAAAVQIGITRNGKFSHEGLSSATIRYYWARTVNVFQQASTWYPVSATAGIQGTTVASPSALLSLLHESITPEALIADLQALFLTGEINGVNMLGIDGGLVVDDTIHARSIATGELIVGTNVDAGGSGAYTTIVDDIVTTGYVNALEVEAATVNAGWVYAGEVVANQITARADLFNLVTTSTFPDSFRYTWSTVYNIEGSGGSGTAPRPLFLVTNVRSVIEDVTFQVTPGETLSISSWIETSNAGYPSALGIVFYNAADTEIGDATDTVLAAGQPWTYKTSTAVVPAGASYAAAFVYIAGFSSFGFARFSDMKISRQGSISADQVNAVEINANSITAGSITTTILPILTNAWFDENLGINGGALSRTITASGTKLKIETFVMLATLNNITVTLERWSGGGYTTQDYVRPLTLTPTGSMFFSRPYLDTTIVAGTSYQYRFSVTGGNYMDITMVLTEFKK